MSHPRIRRRLVLYSGGQERRNALGGSRRIGRNLVRVEIEVKVGRRTQDAELVAHPSEELSFEYDPSVSAAVGDDLALRQ